MSEQVISLLRKVVFETNALKKARDRFADRLAPDFSIFDYLRSDEMGLSRCIASLLDPTGKHGQREVFLEAFLKKIGWSENTKIRSVRLEEQANGQRRIDIFLKFESGEIIGIENKPWAGDQENQLSDYASFIEKEAVGNNWLLVYLSNNDPSDYSGAKREVIKKAESEKKFIRLDYSTIIEWLEDCACKSMAPIVRLFIEELAKFIRMKVNGELEMSEENEIRNVILASTDNFKSAFHVALAMKSIKVSLLEKFYDDLKEEVEAKNFELIWDEAMSQKWKSCAGFGVKFKKEQNLYLRFEFYGSGLNNLFWGIMRESNSIKENDVIWNKINEVMSAQFSSGSKPVENWPWWSWIGDNKEFSETYGNWSSSEVPWISIKEKELARKIINLAVLVRDAFDRRQNLNLLSGEVSSNIDNSNH